MTGEVFPASANTYALTLPLPVTNSPSHDNHDSILSRFTRSRRVRQPGLPAPEDYFPGYCSAQGNNWWT
jgi:hypothetical protein